MRALISTIRPGVGGVSSKLAWLVAELRHLNIEPRLAWYEPWSCTPELSLPATRLPLALWCGQRPGQRAMQLPDGWQGEAIGAWLPELEFTHYLGGRGWRRLAAAADLHLAVTGNPLCAARLSLLGHPFLAWVGSDWQGDRSDRVARFPLHRRGLDRLLNAPVLRHLERRALRDPAGRILSISAATAPVMMIFSRDNIISSRFKRFQATDHLGQNFIIRVGCGQDAEGLKGRRITRLEAFP